MTDLSAFSDLVDLDHGLSVLASPRRDGSIAASVVNAGVLPHPLTNQPVVGFVARGLRKLEHLRARPQATVVIRAGWRWAAVEGEVTVIGPDDPQPGVDAEALRRLFRDVFSAAGGAHENWDEYDATMAAERSAAVLVTPRRVYTNPAAG